MDNEFFLYNKRTVLTKLKVVGLLPNPNFQKCRYLLEKLQITYPDKYEKPEVRAMLNLDWDEYLTKMKRRHGKPYYLLQVPVAVYIDGTFLGGDEALVDYIKQHFQLETNLDFQEMGEKELIKYFENVIERYKRQFIYLTVATDERVIGSMLFMLYNDLVPVTCENFIARCTQKEHGYKGSKIHRIAKYSWIQGGYSNKMTHYPMPCENYSVPHDRRGVLSMCNKARHTDNSTQFFITLEPSDWMDYNYVAFGQLIQGAEILNKLEKIPTYYQKPLRKIEIIDCGEFSLCSQMDEEYVRALQPPYDTLSFAAVKRGVDEPQDGVDDVDSVLSFTGYKAGKYYLRTDLRPYLPFSRYSRMFDSYLRALEEQVVEEVAEIEEKVSIQSMASLHEDVIKDRMFNLSRESRAFYVSKNHVVL